MGNSKPDYEIVEDFADIAEALVNKYPEVFGAVDVNVIRCVAVTNKERKEGSSQIWTVRPVDMPIRMDCPYAYYVIVYMKDWIEIDNKHKQLLIAQILQSIPQQPEDEGKVLKYDMHDFAPQLRTFGVDWMSREDVPDLLRDKVDWKI